MDDKAKIPVGEPGFFCNDKFEEKPTVVYQKVLYNICKISEKNHDFELQEKIRKKTVSGDAIMARSDCRRRFQINKKMLIHNLQAVKG